MRSQKPNEWIVGYIFHAFEDKILKFISEQNKTGFGHNLDTDDSIMKVCSVPKVLFGLSADKSKENTLSLSDMGWYCNAVNSELFEVFGKKFTFDIICFPENQYMTFRMKAAKKAPPKKMTLKEIEAVLGYEVEIVK